MILYFYIGRSLNSDNGSSLSPTENTSDLSTIKSLRLLALLPSTGPATGHTGPATGPATGHTGLATGHTGPATGPATCHTGPATGPVIGPPDP